MDKLRALKGLYRGVEHEDEMVGYLPHCTFNLNPRAASIDTPLHAYVPKPYVDHMHPDAIIAVALSAGMRALAQATDGATLLKQRTLALWVAQNRLAVMQLAAAIPAQLKVSRTEKKIVMRDALAAWLPKDVLDRPKMGFGVPLGRWFRGELRGYVHDLLLAPAARYRSMLSGAYVERLVAAHLAGEANLGPQLWSLICFERWLQLVTEWRGHRPAHVT